MKRFVTSIFMIFCLSSSLYAWDLHTLIAYPIISSMPQVAELDEIKVTSFKDFLLSVEDQLPEALAEQEEWSRQNLDFYAPLPEHLKFEATGNPNDITRRFLQAIRVNPNMPLKPYLQLLPGQQPARATLDPKTLSIFKDLYWLENVTFVALNEGEMISPLSVVVSANDEPDLGLDIGLFTDSGSDFGQGYGFGVQAFGNPNLEYGSQAPFHMGFYHEAAIIFAAAPFLKESYPEYRIHQYKTLAKLAFENGQDYWGWRFMGWGLHYLADLSQPYHAVALPGVSGSRMISINLLDMMGASKPLNNAVQLVSNRHTVIEKYERVILEQAYMSGNDDFSQFELLRQERDLPLYSDDMPRDVIAKNASQKARKLNRSMKRNMPKVMVSDPSVEVTELDELEQIVELVAAKRGAKASQEMNQMLGELLEPFAVCGRSYILDIIE